MRTLVSWTLVLVVVAAVSIGMLVSDTGLALAADKETTSIGGIRGVPHGTLPIEVDYSFLADQTSPYLFVLTNYEFIGDPATPEGVRYLPDGQPSALAPDGSSVTLSGLGGWDPASSSATGGGQYTIKDAAGAVTAEGSWQVTSLISFEQLHLDDWWGIPGFREEGWEGGPGAVSFSGFLTVNVNLDNLGDGVLRAWCLMPTAAMTDSHTGDGVSLVGDNFNFGGSEQAELSMFENLDGVMFYSTDPNARGWVLNPAGIATAKDQGLMGFEAPSSPGGGYSN